MRRLTLLGAAAITIGLAVPASAASPAALGPVQNFGPPLAASCHNPEGIAVDPTGNLYAASFAFQPVANICVINRDGVLVDVIPVPAGSAGVASLLGELFEPGQGLYVLDFANGAPGNGRLLLFNPGSHTVRVVAAGFQAPNGLTQDRHRNIYISDSFQGVIFKVAPDGTTSVWKQDPRLTPQPGTGPPFGANGVAFDRNQQFLYWPPPQTRRSIESRCLPMATRGICNRLRPVARSTPPRGRPKHCTGPTASCSTSGVTST